MTIHGAINVQQFLDTLNANPRHQIDTRRGAGPNDINHIARQIAEITGGAKMHVLFAVSAYLSRVEQLLDNLKENLPVGVDPGFKDFEADVDDAVHRLTRGLDMISDEIIERRRS